MPLKIDFLAINDVFLDKRTKLLPCQKLLIIDLYLEGAGIRELSRRFKVDRRLIQFILFPDRYIRNKKLRKIRGGEKQYYKKEAHKIYIKNYRNHKKEILSDKVKNLTTKEVKELNKNK